MTPDHPLPAASQNPSPHWLRSYPAHLSRTWLLPSGQSLRVRAMRHDDGPLEEAFVRSLSLQTRYQRMLTGGFAVTPEWIDSMTHIDYHRHMAYAVTTTSGGVERFIGVGRYVVDATMRSAEMAIVLADAWQGQGLGQRLLATLVEHAQAAGLTEMVGVVLAGNHAMLRVARGQGFVPSPDPDDPDLVRVTRDLRTPRAQPN